MTIYTRPNEIVFAESAKSGEVIDFPDIARGWGITFEETDSQPPMEWFNALTKQQFEAVRYLMQRGVSEWSATEDYPVNALVQFGGQFYVSLQANKGQNPKSSVENWISFDCKYAAKEHAHEQYVSKKDILSMFVGMPFPYPLASAPEGWVTLAGQGIDPAVNPKLASLYGGNLPDLRGLVIRGWDNGRGLDPSRELGPWISFQNDAMQRIYGAIKIWKGVERPAADGAFTATFTSSGAESSHMGGVQTSNGSWDFDSSRVVRTADENRMKNLAFNYITPLG